MTESRHTIDQAPAGNITLDDIERLLPLRKRRGPGVRQYVVEMVFARYVDERPATIRGLAQVYGVTFQRIQQLLGDVLTFFAKEGVDKSLPKGTRLRDAVERQRARIVAQERLKARLATRRNGTR